MFMFTSVYFVSDFGIPMRTCVSNKRAHARLGSRAVIAGQQIASLIIIATLGVLLFKPRDCMPRNSIRDIQPAPGEL